MNPRATRVTALAGLGSFSLIILGAFVSPPLWDAPGVNVPSAQLASYLQTNHARTIAGLYIYSLGIGLFLCFTAGLWSWFRRVERSPRQLSATFAFGAIALAVLILASFATAGVMSYRPQQPAIAVALTDTTFGLLALSGIPTAVCIGAYAVLILRSGCLPSWTAWLGFLAMDAHVLIAASFLSHGTFLGLEGSVILLVPATFFAWILATSVVLWRAAAIKPEL